MAFSQFTAEDNKMYDILESEEDIQYLLDTLKYNLTREKRKNAELRSKLAEWNDNIQKDAAVALLSERLDEVERDLDESFKIPPAIKDNNLPVWINNHDIEEHNNHEHHYGGNGGYEYSFIPNGQFCTGTCYCLTCKMRAMNEAFNNEEKRFSLAQYEDYLKEHSGKYTFECY